MKSFKTHINEAKDITKYSSKDLKSGSSVIAFSKFPLPSKLEKSKNSIPSVFKNFNVLTEYYWGNHALLFSPQGRQKAIKNLVAPYDVQLDALFSRLAMYADYRVFIQASGTPLAKQSVHISTIQTYSSCPMCDTSPNDLPSNLWAVILLILSFVFLFAKQSKCTDVCSDRFYCPKLKTFIKRK